MITGRLPSGLVDPLHLPQPVPWKFLAVLAVLLLAAIVFALLKAWLGRRRRTPRRPLPAPVPALPTGIDAAIESLRRRYRESRAYRAACHELSTLLRLHFEGSSRHRYSTLTAGEIRREVGETRVARFFAFLADLQFGRRQPTGNDLDGACDLAIEIAQGERG